MKDVDPILIALLASGNEYYTTEIYDITLANVSTVIHITSLDIDITVGNILYTSSPISRDSISESTGISVNDLAVTWPLRNTDYIPDTTNPILFAMREGIFDDSELSIHRVFSPKPWGINMGNIDSRYMLRNRYSGLVDVDKAGLITAELKVSSYTKKFDVKLPRNLYNASCNRNFYSNDCGVKRSDLTVSGTVTTGDVNNLSTSLTFADKFYDSGVVTFMSGNNYGIRRTIKSSLNNNIALLKPLPYAPGVGDQIIMYPGCPKTYPACRNQPNYRGYMYIPVPETSM